MTVTGEPSVVGEVEQPQVRPWSTAMRIPTSAGVVWFKASGPGPAHEGPLLEVFRVFGVAHVLLPLAVHPERPWILFEDGGPTGLVPALEGADARIELDLGLGDDEIAYLASDLSYDYVRLNAEYMT